MLTFCTSQPILLKLVGFLWLIRCDKLPGINRLIERLDDIISANRPGWAEVLFLSNTIQGCLANPDAGKSDDFLGKSLKLIFVMISNFFLNFLST